MSRDAWPVSTVYAKRTLYALLLVLSLMLPSVSDQSPETLLVAVGLSDYDSSAIPDLPFVEADIEALCSTMDQIGGVALAITTRKTTVYGKGQRHEMPQVSWSVSDIEELLRQTCEAYPQIKTVVFYFSGHGLTGSNGRHYLLVRDTDLESLAQTAWDLTDVQRRLNNLSIENVVFVIDACRNYSTLKGIGVSRMGESSSRVDPGTLADELSLANSDRNMICLFACRAGEFSQSNAQDSMSLFTEQLCSAMFATRDRGSPILEVFDIVRRTVPSKATRAPQHPFFIAQGGSPMMRFSVPTDATVRTQANRPQPSSTVSTTAATPSVTQDVDWVVVKRLTTSAAGPPSNVLHVSSKIWLADKDTVTVSAWVHNGATESCIGEQTRNGPGNYTIDFISADATSLGVIGSNNLAQHYKVRLVITKGESVYETSTEYRGR